MKLSASGLQTSMAMDWTISVTVFFSVLRGLLGFNIEPVAWRSFSNTAAGFGHKVIQKQNGLLVSAPLEQSSPQDRGQLYECSPTTTACKEIALSLPSYAVNSSLGLAMAFDPKNEKSLVCGPTIPKDCRTITMYNGLCLEIDKNNRLTKTTPGSAPDCPGRPADIAFLLDGSGSVSSGDFQKMKTFVISVISSFLGKDSRFAIVQFSSRYEISYYFDTFQVNGYWQSQINNIRQLSGGTNTATAIIKVVNQVFIPVRGNRQNVNNILIVITDGESQDRHYLPSARDAANRKNIVRFAIGVGNSFSSHTAYNELETIASSSNHVFQVQGFGALDKIRKTLQEKIFSIEGSQTGGETLTMEMSQLGFGAAFYKEGFQMTAVGANEWKGGLLKYTDSGTESSCLPKDIDKDSYLGYSIAIANIPGETFTVVGAPRFQHRGIVTLVYHDCSQKRIAPVDWQFQSGEYFGAEVCTMDVNRDSFTDLLLISAPMYSERDREGRVYVCKVSKRNVDCHFDSPLVLLGEPERGRFGSSLAVLPDLNGDNWADLAVGAPLENGGQGSIYIFQGSGIGQINPSFSQRIPASEVKSGLTYFGMSISQTSLDQSGDNLPDLMVGSKGTVVLLRSKPIVQIDTAISFTPQQIPTQNPDCTKPLKATAKVCFPMSKVTELSQAQAKINYTFTLDATRAVPNNRAFLNDVKTQETTGSLTIMLHHENCATINFFIQPCPADALNPLYNKLSYSFEGLPFDGKRSPSLSQQSLTTVNKDLGFEINCGIDDTCTDNLIVDFNFTRTSVVQVGIDDLLSVTVSIENTEENSYNTKVILTYPPGLSYRKFTALKGRIDCTSLDSEDSSTRGETECFIDRPIFKSNAKALFVVSYGFNTKTELDRRIFFTANATSGNTESSTSSQRYKLREIDVRYSISVTVGSSHSYTNFTSGNNDLQKPVNQPIKVTNEIRALNISAVIRVPVKLGDKDIWVDSDNLTIADCSKIKDEEPAITDFVPQVKEDKLVNCRVAKCSVFRCTRFMTQMDIKDYFISANLSSGWIQQIGLESAKFLLISTVTVEYDTDRFIFYTAGTNNNPTIHKIEAEVEVYTEVDFTKQIVGGSLGALALVLLLTAGLYKAGFFKSKYQDMINDAQGQEAAPEDPPAQFLS